MEYLTLVAVIADEKHDCMAYLMMCSGLSAGLGVGEATGAAGCAVHGKAKQAPHTIGVSAEGYEEASMTMQLEGGGKTTRAEIALTKRLFMCVQAMRMPRSLCRAGGMMRGGMWWW